MGRSIVLSLKEIPTVPLPSAVIHLREGKPQLPLKPRLALFWWYKEVQAQDLIFQAVQLSPREQ